MTYCCTALAVMQLWRNTTYNMKHKEHKLYHLVIVAQLEFQTHLRLRLGFAVTTASWFFPSVHQILPLQTFAGFVLTVSGPLIAALDNNLLWLRTSINSSRITLEL